MKTYFKHITIFLRRPQWIFVFLAFIIQIYNVQAQSEKKIERWFNEAKQFYVQENFNETILSCNKVLSGNPEFVDAHLMLSDVYDQLDSVHLEIYHLQKAKELSSNPLIIYRLAEANYKVGNYKEALQNFSVFSKGDSGNGKRINEVQRKILNCEFAIKAKENPVEFQPVKLSEKVNSKNDEYWPNLSLDQSTLVFTRLLKEGRIPQEDFFIAKFDSLDWGMANPMVEINTSQNEGAQSLSADGKLLFFTACNRPEGKGSCDIYYSRLKNGKWSIPENAGNEINSIKWEAQPSFSADNQYLYYSSNRDGGKGRKDIWRSRFNGFNERGKPIFGKAENLGSEINTEGDEMSPFIHPNSVNLYFASDFHIGMGRLDLFHSEMQFDGTFTKTENLGYPINTYKDEQGLIISSTGETAYFASARNSVSGLDIYTFQIGEDMRPDPVSYVKAKVRDAESKLPVKANVELVSLSGQSMVKRMEKTDEMGEVLLSLAVGANYAFNISVDGYLFYSRSFQLKDEKTRHQPFQIDIELETIKMGAEMNLYNIYYETDSFKILPESEPELEKLADFMINNPYLKIEIQGHTDNSGNTIENQNLSELRAKSVLEYLVMKGIDISRLESIGYGESKPVTSNETIEGRKLNRRTTVKIIAKRP